MKKNPYRVIVWGPAAVGRACLRTLIKREDCEIVGVLVYSPDKNGKDYNDGQIITEKYGKNFESNTIQAAMAATHVFGLEEKVREKCTALKRIFGGVGRNHADIEITANCMPQIMPDDDPDVLTGLGATHLNAFATGPDWDLGPLKELLAWRKAKG
jgi:hypothetical protein